MARIKVTGLGKVQSAIIKEIKLLVKTKEVRTTVGMIVVAGIRGGSEGIPTKTTIEFRKFFEQYNKTHPDYRRQNINITFTGELLDDLKKSVKVKTTGGAIAFNLEHSKKLHKPYKTGGKGSKNKIAYKLISEYLIEKGYDYLDVDEKTVKRLQRYLRLKIYRQLSKKFN